MRSVRLCVRFCLLLLGLVAFCDPVTAQLPEVPPIDNLKRARFQHVVMNRDETLILTATNTMAQLWDLRTGALIQTFEGHRASMTTVCFSPDEQQMKEWEFPPTWIDFQKAILLGAYQSSIFSPSGRTVFTTVRTADGAEVQLLDAETGHVRQRF